MDLEKQELRKKHRRARKMMLLFSLLSITMTFAGLTSAYIVSKARPDWLTDFQLPNYFFISTVIIIISSLSMWLAKTNVKKNNFSKTSLWLGVTFLLSLFFIFSQFAGYQELINDGLPRLRLALEQYGMESAYKGLEQGNNGKSDGNPTGHKGREEQLAKDQIQEVESNKQAKKLADDGLDILI